MASSWSARSSNMLPISSRMLTVRGGQRGARLLQLLMHQQLRSRDSAPRHPAVHGHPPIEERGGLTGGGVGLGVAGV
ncbi:hypothetical protein F7725_004022 [Dissostichus mawsoni]|uniref:Uncharacterized protein n=1 Tax=Dissostichus mawsoni TaxID=36200 RepID=A0A7J5YBW5_DISMA|nr:hypothetical protein F7725_004022 [Dissostichus mawsoni]